MLWQRTISDYTSAPASAGWRHLGRITVANGQASNFNGALNIYSRSTTSDTSLLATVYITVPTNFNTFQIRTGYIGSVASGMALYYTQNGSGTSTTSFDLWLRRDGTSAVYPASIELLKGSTGTIGIPDTSLAAPTNPVQIQSIAGGGGSASVPDATSSVKGILQLAGDLAGTAASPELATVSRTNTTSTTAPAAGTTFTAIDSVTTDGKGRVTGANTKTVTLPAASGGGSSSNPVWYGTTNSNASSAFSIAASGLTIASGSIIGILFSAAQSSSTTGMTLALTGTNDTAAKGLFHNGTQLTKSIFGNYVSTTQISLWQYDGIRWNLLNPIAIGNNLPMPSLSTTLRQMMVSSLVGSSPVPAWLTMNDVFGIGTEPDKFFKNDGTWDIPSGGLSTIDKGNNVDFNTLTATGVYKLGTGSTNYPNIENSSSNSGWTVVVFAGNTQGIIQFATYYSNSRTGIYYRNRTAASTWTAWAQMGSGGGGGSSGVSSVSVSSPLNDSGSASAPNIGFGSVSANNVLAGPALSGGGQPSFRRLNCKDLANSGAIGQFLKWDSDSTSPIWANGGIPILDNGSSSINSSLTLNSSMVVRNRQLGSTSFDVHIENMPVYTVFWLRLQQNNLGFNVIFHHSSNASVSKRINNSGNVVLHCIKIEDDVRILEMNKRTYEYPLLANDHVLNPNIFHNVIRWTINTSGQTLTVESDHYEIGEAVNVRIHNNSSSNQNFNIKHNGASTNFLNNASILANAKINVRLVKGAGTLEYDCRWNVEF